MNVNEIIKYPVLSEKTYAQMENGVYTFAVDPRTNRAEVKKAIEFIFDVKVSKVNIINVDKQPTKLGRSEGFTNKVKKAIVKLSDGQINIFPDEVENNVKQDDAPKKVVKDKEMSDVEKKAAEKIAAKLAEKSLKQSKVETQKDVESTKTETKVETEIKKETETNK